MNKPTLFSCDDHEILTNFLYAIYNWRSDLRENFNVATEKGSIKFIFWWLNEGYLNYPNTPIEYGLSKEFILKHIFSLGNNHPPLSKYLSFKDDTSFDFKYYTWLFQWGYTEFLEKDTEFNRSVICNALLWLEKNEELVDASINNLFKNKILDVFDYQGDIYLFREEYGSLVSIYGKPHLNIGIGYDAKLIYKSLKTNGINAFLYQGDKIIKSPINIFTLPAPDAMVELTKIEHKLHPDSINILSSPWELPVWPESLEFLLEFFDEIWVHTNYVKNGIPEKYQYKVKKIILPVEVGYNIEQKPPEDLNEKFTVLTSFDLASFLTRKNPYASIDAFIKAFENEDKCEVVLKINGADLRPAELLKLENYIVGHKNIKIISEQLPLDELHKLYSKANCFISLHRSEGFGRNIAEMMLLKVPVIVTAFSGNMDFTKDDNSYLVPYSKIPLKPDDYIFSKDQYWADADVNTAADILRDIYLNGVDKTKIKNAYDLISKKYSIENAGQIMKKNLEELVCKLK